MNIIQQHKWILIFPVLLLLNSCQEYAKVSEDRFIGDWEIQGRSMFDGMVIRIVRKEGKFIGKIIKLNDNKYVKMFAETEDVWISEITRQSNYQFRIKEKKIAAPLFSLYGSSTSVEYNVQFINENSFGLAKEGQDPLASSIIYKRIK